jgi:hypothetical protein
VLFIELIPIIVDENEKFNPLVKLNVEKIDVPFGKDELRSLILVAVAEFIGLVVLFEINGEVIPLDLNPTERVIVPDETVPTEVEFKLTIG